MFNSSMSGNEVKSSPERLNVLYYGTCLTEVLLIDFKNHTLHTPQHIQIQCGNRSINVRI